MIILSLILSAVKTLFQRSAEETLRFCADCTFFLSESACIRPRRFLSPTHSPAKIPRFAGKNATPEKKMREKNFCALISLLPASFSSFLASLRLGSSPRLLFLFPCLPLLPPRFPAPLSAACPCPSCPLSASFLPLFFPLAPPALNPPPNPPLKKKKRAFPPRPFPILLFRTLPPRSSFPSVSCPSIRRLSAPPLLPALPPPALCFLFLALSLLPLPSCLPLAPESKRTAGISPGCPPKDY